MSVVTVTGIICVMDLDHMPTYFDFVQLAFSPCVVPPVPYRAKHRIESHEYVARVPEGDNPKDDGTRFLTQEYE